MINSMNVTATKTAADLKNTTKNCSNVAEVKRDGDLPPLKVPVMMHLLCQKNLEIY